MKKVSPPHPLFKNFSKGVYRKGCNGNLKIVINYILEMLPLVAGSLPMFIIFRTISVNLIMKKKNLVTNIYHETGLAVFFCIMAGIFYLAVVPKSPLVGISAEYLNLIPFTALRDLITSLSHGSTYYLTVNIIGNIAVFAPIGIFVPLLWRNISFRKTVLIGCLSSMFIEISQLPQMRVTDIDDVLLNTLGAIIGFLIYMLINKLFPKFSNKFKIQKL